MLDQRVRVAIRIIGLLWMCYLLMAAPFVAAHNDNAGTEPFVERNGISYHEEGPNGSRTGRLPASSLNVDIVGHLTVHDARPGLISDVGVRGNFAYLGQFAPGCEPDDGGGIYIIDISDPTDPTEIGFIKTPGTYVGEGVQVIPVQTDFFSGDLLVVNGESCDTISNRIGGFSLYDVTDPYHPVVLVENFGDFRRVGNETRANQIHSAFAWGQNGKAYVVTVDDEEATDVDIFDITDPAAPELLIETGLSSWPNAQDAQADGMGTFRASFLHDMVVKKIDGHWLMLLSYWDAGYIILNVDDPAGPVFVDDTSFTSAEQGTAIVEIEGNAHQAEWSHGSQFIIGTEEDFSPFRMQIKIDSGSFAGETLMASPGNPSQQVAESDPISGPTYYVGYACSNSLPPKAPSSDAIAVVLRGSCSTEQKVANIKNAGYTAGILVNGAATGRCEEIASIAASESLPLIMVGRSTGFMILGITGYNPANCTNGMNPSLPTVGTQGTDVTIAAQFDGWGAVHLFDAATLTEIDTFAVAESTDVDYATGFGNLSPHEVAVDSRDDLAYLSYYEAGFRVLRFGEAGIREVGHFIDTNGNNLWGVQVFRLPNNLTTYVAASDRDKGLWILEYTGP